MSGRRIDLHNLAYLAEGTPRQRDALRVIRELRIWEVLAAYTPGLAGTVPLGIDNPQSDLDVICEAHDFEAVERDIGRLWEPRDINIFRDGVRGVETVLAGFMHDSGWWIELFAQPVPVARQRACLHLLVEERLLEIGGKPARDAIRQLKCQGVHTEPAFTAYFGIVGDPYEELARLAGADDEELRQAISRAL